MSPRRSRLALFLLAFAVCVPPLLVYAILFREALAIPILDDYHAVFDFALNFTQLHSAREQFVYVLTVQHDAYRLMFEHVIMAAQLAILHHISLSFLVTLGNLMLLPIFYVLWANYFADENNLFVRLALFLPVSFLLFQLNYAETLDWSMGSLQNIAVIAFALLSLHFLARTSATNFSLAWICAALSCASSANGFLLAPAGLLMLLQQRGERKLAPWKIALWTAVFCMMLALYLYHYVYPPPLPHTAFGWKVLFFLSFSGGAVENMHGWPVPHLAIFVGAAICLVFADAVRTRYREVNPFAFFSTIWIFLSAMLVAAIRIAMGLQLSLSGRYKIYCDLLLIFCYAYLAQRLRTSSMTQMRRRTMYFGAVSIIVLFSLGSDVVGYKLLEKRRQRVLDGISQYLANPAATTPMINPNETTSPEMQLDQEQARVRLNRALQTGIYALPPHN